MNNPDYCYECAEPIAPRPAHGTLRGKPMCSKSCLKKAQASQAIDTTRENARNARR